MRALTFALCTSLAVVTAPALAEDGPLPELGYAAFDSNLATPGGRDVFMYKIGSNEPPQLIARNARRPSFSPDGRWLAYERIPDLSIFVVRPYWSPDVSKRGELPPSTEAPRRACNEGSLAVTEDGSKAYATGRVASACFADIIGSSRWRMPTIWNDDNSGIICQDSEDVAPLGVVSSIIDCSQYGEDYYAVRPETVELTDDGHVDLTQAELMYRKQQTKECTEWRSAQTRDGLWPLQTTRDGRWLLMGTLLCSEGYEFHNGTSAKGNACVAMVDRFNPRDVWNVGDGGFGAYSSVLDKFILVCEEDLNQTVKASNGTNNLNLKKIGTCTRSFAAVRRGKDDWTLDSQRPDETPTGLYNDLRNRVSNDGLWSAYVGGADCVRSKEAVAEVYIHKIGDPNTKVAANVSRTADANGIPKVNDYPSLHIGPIWGEGPARMSISPDFANFHVKPFTTIPAREFVVLNPRDSTPVVVDSAMVAYEGTVKDWLDVTTEVRGGLTRVTARVKNSDSLKGPTHKATITVTGKIGADVVSHVIDIIAQVPHAEYAKLKLATTEILSGGQIPITANIVDQYGAPVNSAIKWTVSTGGYVKPITTGRLTTQQGVFLSDGSAGDIEITADAEGAFGYANIKVKPRELVSRPAGAETKLSTPGCSLAPNAGTPSAVATTAGLLALLVRRRRRN